MNNRNKLLSFTAILMIAFGLSACAPEVGSKKWCQMMEDKPKGDWSANEAADYTKHCLFSSND
jgi:hypothetical protein